LGAILYGTNGASLVTLDPDSQAVEVIGGHGITGLQSLAFHSGEGVFYGTTDYFGYGERALWSIDPLTGAATKVGNLTADLYSLDYDAGRNALYGLGSSAALYRINTQPFSVDYIGDGDRTFTYSLAIDDEHDVFYAEAKIGPELFSIDPATGTATTIGNVDIPGMAWIWLDSMAYDEQADRLIGVDGGLRWVVSIDPLTMTTTSLGGAYSLPFALSGMDYAPNVIPEPATFAIWSLLGITTITLGFLRRKRRPIGR
jgi:hypothetical protein